MPRRRRRAGGHSAQALTPNPRFLRRGAVRLLIIILLVLLLGCAAGGASLCTCDGGAVVLGDGHGQPSLDRHPIQRNPSDNPRERLRGRLEQAHWTSRSRRAPGAARDPAHRSEMISDIRFVAVPTLCRKPASQRGLAPIELLQGWPARRTQCKPTRVVRSSRPVR